MISLQTIQQKSATDTLLQQYEHYKPTVTAVAVLKRQSHKSTFIGS